MVMQPARDCSSIRSVEKRLPERPRLLLTTDQLFTDHVMWIMGSDPFEWDPRTDQQDDERALPLAYGFVTMIRMSPGTS